MYKLLSFLVLIALIYLKRCVLYTFLNVIVRFLFLNFINGILAARNALNTSSLSGERFGSNLLELQTDTSHKLQNNSLLSVLKTWGCSRIYKFKTVASNRLSLDILRFWLYFTKRRLQTELWKAFRSRQKEKDFTLHAINSYPLFLLQN